MDYEKRSSIVAVNTETQLFKWVGGGGAYIHIRGVREMSVYNKTTLVAAEVFTKF